MTSHLAPQEAARRQQEATRQVEIQQEAMRVRMRMEQELQQYTERTGAHQHLDALLMPGQHTQHAQHAVGQARVAPGTGQPASLLALASAGSPARAYQGEHALGLE